MTKHLKMIDSLVFKEKRSTNSENVLQNVINVTFKSSVSLIIGFMDMFLLPQQS